MEAVRKNNRAEILRLVNEAGPISKKDIAEALGLTPAAVTQLCSDILDNGLLVETGLLSQGNGKAGRKKVLIDINAEYGYIYSVNIDSAVTTVSLCNIKGQRKAYATLDTDEAEDADAFLKNIAMICKKLSKDCGISKEKILGAGVGVPGFVDKENGISVHAYGVWKEPVSVEKVLGQYLDTKVYVENNVSAFAIAELMFGQGREAHDCLLVKWGPGVGASIIHDGRIWDSKNGKAAELGHFIVDPDGKPCSCGRRGCLETVISKKALEGKSIEEKAHAVRLFAQAVVNAVSLLEPQKVVLYGTMFQDLKMQKQMIDACSFFDHRCAEQKIMPSGLIDQEDYIGPAAYVIYRFLF